MASPDSRRKPQWNTGPQRNVKTSQSQEAPLGRFGPFERAIRTKDLILLHDEIRKRTESDPLDAAGCWIWVKAARENGYAYVGRAETLRLVHRVVAWAFAGFPGELRDFPEVHHSCGNTLCQNPDHLQPTTTLLNVLESRVRSMVIRRTRALEDALRQLQPTHPLLVPVWELKAGLDVSMTRLSQTSESRKSQLRRLEKNAAYERRLEVNRLSRFQQVLAVDALFAKGVRRKDALKSVGMTRQAYDDWRRRLGISLG